ncbi:MAG: hypothetical protein PHG39_05940 [Acidithiobacillus ferrooxidans]|nr:hypothetical protein [Acidithiobacillus ferrooxidans]MDD5003485.1 hypothetical protein [Acidithiobacillus sp.]MDD5378505.1 hypothetical protein [Acidithiobacillus sp.]MDD5575475.1 hypothetical protein [Acidithiobacillus sp.]
MSGTPNAQVVRKPNLSIPLNDVIISQQNDPIGQHPECLLPENRSLWEIDKKAVFLFIPLLGRFRILAGKRIDYMPNPDVDPRLIQSLIASMGYSLLICQRGELPIHGSGVIAPNETRATIICASSGIGKSTTTAALSLMGWAVIADDICRMSLESDIDGEPEMIVHRGYTDLRLTPSACDLLDINTTPLSWENQRCEKFFFRPDIIAPKMSYPVERIIILHRPAHTLAMEWGKCSGDVAIEALARNIYYTEIGTQILDRERVSLYMKYLAANIPVYVLFVPEGIQPGNVALELQRLANNICSDIA